MGRLYLKYETDSDNVSNALRRDRVRIKVVISKWTKVAQMECILFSYDRTVDKIIIARYGENQNFRIEWLNGSGDHDALTELRSLSKLINNSLDSIEKYLIAQKVTFPSLNDTYSPQNESSLSNPVLDEAAAIIVSAAAQLSAMVRPPPLTVMTTAFQYHVSSALRVAVETHVVEILREAGPEGLHIDEISRKNKTDPIKLARILRLLATENIFREVRPDVFANNRISSVLDTGKSSDELVAKPSEKHTDTSGIAACVIHATNHGFKSSAYMTEAMLDPNFALSHEADRTAFNKAFRTDLKMFAWFEQPGNEVEHSILGMAMEGGKNMSPGNDVEGFDWEALPKGSVVVDVGGNTGSQTLTLAKKYPQLNLIVQDREAVMKDAQRFWEQEMPEALAEGKVQLQASDFFTSQPVKNAAVYFLRTVLHDWSDDDCCKILKHLRASATPDTQLLIIENIMLHACPETNTGLSSRIQRLPPSPLLANNGHANSFKYLADLLMLVLLNGQERTLSQFKVLLERAGWKLVKIAKESYVGTFHQHLVAIPA